MLRLEATDDFKVTWGDPADAELPWIWDEMHTPRPLTPMAQLLGESSSWQTFGARQAVVKILE